MYHDRRGAPEFDSHAAASAQEVAMKQPLAACLVAAPAILLFPGALAAEIVTPEQKIEALRPLAQQCGGGNDRVKQDLIKSVAGCARADFFRPMTGADGTAKALLGLQHAGQALMTLARETRNDDAFVLGFLLCQKPQVECLGAPNIPVGVAKATAEAAAILDVATVSRLANALAPSLGTCAGNDGGLAKIVLEDAGCLAFLRQMALDEDALGSTPSPASAALSGAASRAP